MGSAAERRKSGGDDGEDPEWEGFGGCELPLVFLFYAGIEELVEGEERWFRGLRNVPRDGAASRQADRLQ